MITDLKDLISRLETLADAEHDAIHRTRICSTAP